jgi:hypothetical protein
MFIWNYVCDRLSYDALVAAQMCRKKLHFTALKSQSQLIVEHVDIKILLKQRLPHFLLKLFPTFFHKEKS